jgi:hypothetical protein
MSKHYFKASLAKGDLGEAKLLKLFPALIKLDGRHGDLMLGDAKIELKTDFYDSNKTANFFIERYSDAAVGSPGGPWQAKAHGCQYFVYQFLNCGSGWVFSTDEVVTALDSIISTIKPVEVKNVRWTTIGFKVPRAELTPLCLLSWRLDKQKPVLFTCVSQLFYKLLLPLRE